MDFESALNKQLSERQRKKNSNVERVWSPKQIQNAFIESFELIGGVPRLALWGNEPENYESFLKLLIAIAPKGAQAAIGEQMGKVLEYRSNVPPSPLNRPAPEQEIAEGEFTDG